MNARASLYVMLLHGGISIIVVLAATVLAFHGSLDAPTVSVIYGAAIGLAGGTAGSLATLGQAVNGKSTMRDEVLHHAIKSMQESQPTPPV